MLPVVMLAKHHSSARSAVFGTSQLEHPSILHNVPSRGRDSFSNVSNRARDDDVVNRTTHTHVHTLARPHIGYTHVFIQHTLDKTASGTMSESMNA